MTGKGESWAGARGSERFPSAKAAQADTPHSSGRVIADATKKAQRAIGDPDSANDATDHFSVSEFRGEHDVFTMQSNCRGFSLCESSFSESLFLLNTCGFY